MNWKLDIGNWKLTRQGFTIVELVVAMGLLVMLVGLSSVVFSTTVKAHRKATATIEITRNLRVLTEQLNADFAGLRKDAPLMLWFDSAVTADGERRFDMLHFFADGDFQTTKQYRYDSNGDGVFNIADTASKTIYGNIARVFYGHANSASTEILARKSHILTVDSSVLTAYGEIPGISNAGVIDYTTFDDNLLGFGRTKYPGNTYFDENQLEFNTITLTNWINALNYLDLPANPNNADHFVAYCLTDAARPVIDLADFETLHLLMAQGVMDFSVQWAYTNDDLVNLLGMVPNPPKCTGVQWWPGVNPAGDGSVASDFAGMAKDQFGVYFTLSAGTNTTNWFSIGNCMTNGVRFSNTFYPKALKFTFRLKDSNKIFPAGKTFTHIVYLDN